MLQPEGTLGSLGAFGLGWILACAFLSGSPVAAIALGLLAGGVMAPRDSFAMVMGSRIGASFVVLVIGFLYDWRSPKVKGGIYVGALALLTTVSVYLPALLLGHLLLSSELLSHLSLAWMGTPVSLIDAAFSPFVSLFHLLLPAWLQTLAGMGLILGAFKLFDMALPTVDPTGGLLGQMATTIYRPSVAFLFGMIVTSITLSVSVSLALLVPLTVRGVVRRENLIPYILGANITTFIDTLIASLLLVGHPEAFTVVACAVLAVTIVSLPVVFLAYRPYERVMDELANWATANRRRLSIFLFALFAIPLFLILVAHVA